VALLPGEMQAWVSREFSITSINYPVLSYPQKIKSLNIESTPVVEGLLAGIKGQYIILDGGEVLNIRKIGGYFVRITV
jgi:hypothetical protein